MGEVFEFPTGRKVAGEKSSETSEEFERIRSDLKKRLMELSDVLVATPGTFPDKRLLTDVIAGLGLLLNPENLQSRVSRLRAAATELSNAAAETQREYDSLKA